MLLIQLRLIFFAVSFGKLWKLLNQKKVCFPLRIKKYFSTRTLLYITAKKNILFFGLLLFSFNCLMAATYKITCEKEDCFQFGWSMVSKDGKYRLKAICKENDCKANGWMSQDTKGSKFDVNCREKSCFEKGWLSKEYRKGKKTQTPTEVAKRTGKGLGQKSLSFPIRAPGAKDIHTSVIVSPYTFRVFRSRHGR